MNIRVNPPQWMSRGCAVHHASHGEATIVNIDPQRHGVVVDIQLTSSGGVKTILFRPGKDEATLAPKVPHAA